MNSAVKTTASGGGRNHRDAAVDLASLRAGSVRCIYLPVAVVGRRPHSEHRLVEVPLVALHDQLVCPTDHVDVVGSVELGNHVAPEQVPGTSGTHPPPSGV